MADTVVRNNWQRAGPTISEEHANTTHLRPSDLRDAGLVDAPNARLSPQLSRRSSVRNNVAHLSRNRSFKRSPAARWRHFVARFNWNQRSKAYAFSKACLQRQPSFIVTPDRSSHAYSFKNRDLVKRKPRPRTWQTSHPIAVWKNPKPMDVLANNGRVDLPPFMMTTEESGAPGPSSGLHAGGPNLEVRTGVSTEGPTLTGLAPTTAGPTAGPSSNALDDVLQPQQSLAPKVSPMDDQKKHLVKISLPVKHNRTSSNSNVDATAQHSTSTSTPGTVNTNRSQSSSWLDAIPQTPVATAQRRHKRAVGAASTGDADMSEPQSHGSKALQSSTEPTTPVPSHQRKFAGFNDLDDELASPLPSNIKPSTPGRAMATTSGDSPPQTPTALPSNYRPESWRRSAVIARNSVDPVTGNGLYVDVASDFTGTWSAYLRRAIAQRAIESRERKSWELRNEIRWSQNMEWDSDSSISHRDDYSDSGFYGSSSESKSGSSPSSSSSDVSRGDSRRAEQPPRAPSSADSGHMEQDEPSKDKHGQSGSGPSTSQASSISSSSGDPPQTPISRTTMPRGLMETPLSNLGSGPRAVTEDSVSVQPLQMASPKRQSLSRLAPLNSPREMASASASAIALARAKSQPASAATSVAGSAASLLPDQRAAESAPELPEQMHTPFTTSGEPPLRFSSLMAMGGALETTWQAENSPQHSHSSPRSDVSSSVPSSASSSSSHLNEHEEYVFPPHSGLGVVPTTMHDGTEQHTFHSQEPYRANLPGSAEGHSKSLSGIDFDFSDRGSARKRQLPESPVGTPPHSPGPQDSGEPPKASNPVSASAVASSHSSHKPGLSVESDATTGSSSVNTVIEPIEGAADIVRSHSLWKNQSKPKRVKNSSSQELLVHTRQKTMESMWGGEDEDESDNANS